MLNYCWYDKNNLSGKDFIMYISFWYKNKWQVGEKTTFTTKSLQFDVFLLSRFLLQFWLNDPSPLLSYMTLRGKKIEPVKTLSPFDHKKWRIERKKRDYLQFISIASSIILHYHFLFEADSFSTRFSLCWALILLT